MNKGEIKAQADEGHGGNIRIIADQLINSADSLIDASSKKGLNGNIRIESPEDTVSDNLVVLFDDKMDVGTLLRKPCSTYVTKADRSFFHIHMIQGVGPSPHDRQGSDVLPAHSQIARSTSKVTNPFTISTCQRLSSFSATTE